MARKKRKPEKKKPQRGRSSSPRDQLPDRRLTEARMWGDLMGSLDTSSPQGKAQQLLMEAYHAGEPARRISLARKALESWPDCADAYVLLAENAPSAGQAVELYRQGLAAGQRALGPRGFEQAAGHFWGILETRPYMRACAGLAHALWANNQRDESIAELQEMLRLNPNDNQGVRYTLAGFLLAQDRERDLAELLAAYPDEATAAWGYTKALLAYRQEGDTAKSRTLLKWAQKRNPHVPEFLLGHRRPGPLTTYSIGDESEANNYAFMFLGAWKATTGAVAWCRDTLQPPPTPAASTQGKGPKPAVQQRLQQLPQESDVWQADVVRLPTWVEDAGEPRRPWCLVVISRDSNLVLAQEILLDLPTSAQLWDVLAAAMEQPLAGEPHRPTELQLRTGAEPVAEPLRPKLEALGIPLVLTDTLDRMEDVLQSLSQHLAGSAEPGLLDVVGVGPQLVSGLYEAAAEFYRRAPWRSLGGEVPLKIECSKFQSGPWYAIIMGQAGMTMGLTLYEDLKLLRRLLSGSLSDEENARLTTALTLLYGEAFDIAIADLEASERYGWVVAAPEAYPSIFRKERGMVMRPPLAWEIELMEGCLRAVPDFIARHLPGDPTRATVTVSTTAGELTLILSWMPAS